MFANAVMYNKSTTEIVKETYVMARDVEGMVNNFRGAEEVGMRKVVEKEKAERGKMKVVVAESEKGGDEEESLRGEGSVAGEDEGEGIGRTPRGGVRKRGGRRGKA